MQKLHTCDGDRNKRCICLPCRFQIAFLSQSKATFVQLHTIRDDAQDKKGIRQAGFGVDRLTWKAFRAGHATHLAARGSHISEIMQAGEWKSKALLDYRDPDTIDAVVFLNAILNASDNEGDN